MTPLHPASRYSIRNAITITCQMLVRLRYFAAICRHISRHEDTRTIIYPSASRHLTIIILLIWKATNLDFILICGFLFLFLFSWVCKFPHHIRKFILWKVHFKHNNLVKQTTEGNNCMIFQVTCSDATATFIEKRNIRREFWNANVIIAHWLRNENCKNAYSGIRLCMLNHRKVLSRFQSSSASWFDAAWEMYEMLVFSMSNTLTEIDFHLLLARKLTVLNCFHLKYRTTKSEIN